MVSPKTYGWQSAPRLDYGAEVNINVGASIFLQEGSPIEPSRTSTIRKPTIRKTRRPKYVGREKELLLKISKMLKLHNRFKKGLQSKQALSVFKAVAVIGNFWGN